MRGALFVAIVAFGVCAPPVLAAGSRAADGPTAVIALGDTGVNPYHVEFRDTSSRGQRHPSTYLPGFPKDATALRLTFDAPDYRSAVRADCERVWRQVTPGRLYWFPGTKIVGAISLQSGFDVTCASFPSRAPILDDVGHGTMVASRAAANSYGACAECRLVVVEGMASGFRWIAGNSAWIDVASHSWGGATPLWSPVGNQTLPTPAGTFAVGTYDSTFVRDMEAAARRHPTFVASGNGLPYAGSVASSPTVIDAGLTPSVLSVGGHDAGYVTHWSNSPPHLAADACASRAASSDSLAESRPDAGSGTSAAAPYAAGAAARLLLTARRLLGDRRTGVHEGVAARGRRGVSGPLADGQLTLAEWRRLLLTSATPRPRGGPEDGPTCPADGFYPTTPVRYADLPAAFPEYLTIGYGAVDGTAIALAAGILSGKRPAPDRTRTDSFFTLDDAARRAQHGIYAR